MVEILVEVLVGDPEEVVPELSVSVKVHAF